MAPVWLSWRAVLWAMAATWLKERVGLSCSQRATTPVMKGVAMEVPCMTA